MSGFRHSFGGGQACRQHGGGKGGPRLRFAGGQAWALSPAAGGSCSNGRPVPQRPPCPRRTAGSHRLYQAAPWLAHQITTTLATLYLPVNCASPGFQGLGTDAGMSTLPAAAPRETPGPAPCTLSTAHERAPSPACLPEDPKVIEKPREAPSADRLPSAPTASKSVQVNSAATVGAGWWVAGGGSSPARCPGFPGAGLSAPGTRSSPLPAVFLVTQPQRCVSVSADVLLSGHEMQALGPVGLALARAQTVAHRRRGAEAPRSRVGSPCPAGVRPVLF